MGNPGWFLSVFRLQQSPVVFGHSRERKSLDNPQKMFCQFECLLLYSMIFTGNDKSSCIAAFRDTHTEVPSFIWSVSE